MPIISSIKPQKKRKNWVNIFIDNEFALSLPLDTFVREKLTVNLQVSKEKIENLIKEGDFLSIYDKTLRYLSFRPRSTEEIKQYLNQQEAGKRTQSLIIEKLIDQKLIDDETFARWWTDQRRKFRNQGEKLTRIELINKGIERDLIDKIFAENPVNEDVLIEELIRKKLPKLGRLPLPERKKKLYGFLLRRGYGWGEIRTIVDKMLKKK